jgi:hypothetical protein
MAKRVRPRPDWLHAAQVVDVYSVSNCVSPDFADYINFWQHNGYWFFDSSEIIRQTAHAHALDLAGTSLFYYEAHDLAFHAFDRQWTSFQPEPSFTTHVIVPTVKDLAGYDVVTFSVGTSPECSPLSCNSLASDVETNPHCLLTSLEQAQRLLEAGHFTYGEPGPYRIFAVYSVAWP